MKEVLIKQGFNKEDIIAFGNMFLLGNGRFGYRGTLEEYGKNEMVNLTCLGFYDKYKDLWREPINIPNPFYLKAEGCSVLKDQILHHEQSLDIKNGLFSRYTEFSKYIVKSKRFVSASNKNLLVDQIVIEPKEECACDISFGLDLDISEINGPHFSKKEVVLKNNSLIFLGTTNEGKKVSTINTYITNKECSFIQNGAEYLFRINSKLAKKEKVIITIFTTIYKNDHNLEAVEYNFCKELKNHTSCFNKMWRNLSFKLIGDIEAEFELNYSIYQLLILIDEESYASIPARGISGQTYKGAVFWDTEMFIMPSLLFISPKMARNTLVYRINTLNGALAKAKKYGYKGAFYAWESQDDGMEQCSEYNVSDPVTNEPIRTYFNEKQIHISADIVYAIDRYIENTKDFTILKDGGYKVIDEVIRFFISYASKGKDGLLHFNDVIGPDEYHERINDNAFTNQMIKFSAEIAEKYYGYSKYFENVLSLNEITKFKNSIYIVKENDQKIIEQFDGYFRLEDAKPDVVKTRVKNEKEYLGGEKGVATPTKTIKQADVVAMLVLMDSELSKLKANYEYYLPFTEHGSSLSSSMYSIAAARCGDVKTAYELFRKSSGIDLGGKQKHFAGGIYIGGTHPASNAGAILSFLYGLLGFKNENGKISFTPRLPDHIKGTVFSCKINGKSHKFHVKNM